MEKQEKALKEAKGEIYKKASISNTRLRQKK